VFSTLICGRRSTHGALENEIRDAHLVELMRGIKYLPKEFVDRFKQKRRHPRKETEKKRITLCGVCSHYLSSAGFMGSPTML
jgi:hypothetical protein